MKQLLMSALLAAGVAAVGPAPASAVSIGFSPASPISVLTGDTFSVDLVVSDLGSEVVSAFDVDVTYDTGLLNPIDYIFSSEQIGGGPLGDWSAFETVNNDDFFVDPFATAGIVDLFETSLLSDTELAALQGGGPVTLATIEFEAIDNGDANLNFIWDAFNDVKGRNNKPIIPSSVPEPTTIALYGLGLALVGLAGLRRKAVN